MARFVSVLLTALRAGAIDSTTSQIGFPRVVTNASSRSASPSLAVLRTVSSSTRSVLVARVSSPRPDWARRHTIDRQGRAQEAAPAKRPAIDKHAIKLISHQVVTSD